MSSKVASLARLERPISSVGRAPRHVVIDTCHCLCYKLPSESRSVKDAFGRGYSRKRSECGARVRTDTIRSRAVPGIMLAGTTTGPGGAFPGLGQAGAGNARGTARGLRPPVGAPVQGRTSCHVPGNLAWSCAERARAATVSAAVERRQASAPPPYPPPHAGEGKETRARAASKVRRLGNSVCRRSASFICWKQV